MNSPKYLGNYITRYSITKEDIIGKSPDNKKEYDKIMLVFVYLNSQSTNFCEFTKLLNTLFSNKLDYESKITILKKEHNIILEDDKKEVLNEMCNLAEGLEEMITEEVTERVTKDVTASVTASVTADSIRKTANIMKKSGMNEQQILALICEEFNMSEEEIQKILNRNL